METFIFIFYLFNDKRKKGQADRETDRHRYIQTDERKDIRTYRQPTYRPMDRQTYLEDERMILVNDRCSFVFLVCDVSSNGLFFC
jgi:hypothetical protein